jgi:hypothetical protein
MFVFQIQKSLNVADPFVWSFPTLNYQSSTNSKCSLQKSFPNVPFFVFSAITATITERFSISHLFMWPPFHTADDFCGQKQLGWIKREKLVVFRLADYGLFALRVQGSAKRSKAKRLA